MSNNNLKNATMAAVLTAVIVTPVFGLQLIRQGARTSMESHWSLVALAAAVVFVFQLLRPWIAKPFQKLKTNLPTLPSAPAKSNKLLMFLILAVAVTWPFFAGRSSVDIATLVLIYVMLGLGLNIVVGFAGLLDLGFVGFYAVGAYTYALLYHWGGWSFWEALPFSGAMAALFGFILGFPVLRLRGDYLAIVTLGFGEIIRIFLNNLNAPVNITNGPQGINRIDTFKVGEFAFGRTESLLGIRVTGPEKYYYLLLALTLIIILVCVRLQNSRIGRAWEAIREDEIAAKAMGINTRNIKLLAFAMGASFGGVAGALFASMQGFVSPESFSLMESISILCMVVLGGMGHIPGVILGALILAALPEFLRAVVEPVQHMLFGAVVLDPEGIRMLLFGLAMVCVMLFRPAGLWPSAVRKRELATKTQGGAA